MYAFDMDSDRIFNARTERRLSGIFNTPDLPAHWHVVPGADIEAVLSALPSRITDEVTYRAAFKAVRDMMLAGRTVSTSHITAIATAGEAFVGPMRARMDAAAILWAY